MYYISSRTGRCLWDRGHFLPDLWEQETLTKQKRSFNSAFSFHWGKWNFISFRLWFKDTLAESKWELGNQNSQEKGHFSTFHSLFFYKREPSPPPCFGDNTAKIPTKHSASHQKYYFLWFLLWNHLCPPGDLLGGRSVQTTVLILLEVKATGGVSSFSHPTAVRSRHTFGSNESSSQFSQDCQAVRSAPETW